MLGNQTVVSEFELNASVRSVLARNSMSSLASH